MSGKPAARLGDPTACPVPGHGTNPIAVGSPNVLFDSLPAARQGDASVCGGALSGNVIPTVLINGKPATTIGTVGNHGNVVVAGSGTVLIGTSGGGAEFIAPTPLSIMGGFDRAFALQIVGGQSFGSLNYQVVSTTGIEKSGCTSTAGLIDSFSSGARPENITIYISGD